MIIVILLVKDWHDVYNQFKRTAAWYKKKYGNMPVIIFDNVNRLATTHPEILKTLQDGAKDAIDKKEFMTVFVSSDGLAPTQLKGKYSFQTFIESKLVVRK